MMVLVKKSNFNIGRAEMDIWYELWHESKNWLGKSKLKPIYMYYGMEATIPHRGDLKWAKRIAKHYKIEVPK